MVPASRWLLCMLLCDGEMQRKSERVCVCVREREREKERERDGEREGEREEERDCVSNCQTGDLCWAEFPSFSLHHKAKQRALGSYRAQEINSLIERRVCTVT